MKTATRTDRKSPAPSTPSATSQPAQTQIHQEWADEATIATMLGVSVHFVRKLRYQGALRASAINGRMIRIKVQDARDLFEKHAAGGNERGRAIGRCGVWARRTSK